MLEIGKPSREAENPDPGAAGARLHLAVPSVRIAGFVVLVLVCVGDCQGAEWIGYESVEEV